MINKENKERLYNSVTWLLDGTFKTCPHDHYQLFVIEGKCAGKLYFAGIFLLKAKNQKTCTSALEMLKK